MNSNQERATIALSLKALEDDPLTETFDRILPLGSVAQARVRVCVYGVRVSVGVGWC